MKKIIPKPNNKVIKFRDSEPAVNKRPEFPPVDTTRFDTTGAQAWSYGMLYIHTQDQRMTDFERAVIMDIGNRLYGRILVN